MMGRPVAPASSTCDSDHRIALSRELRGRPPDKGIRAEKRGAEIVLLDEERERERERENHGQGLWNQESRCSRRVLGRRYEWRRHHLRVWRRRLDLWPRRQRHSYGR